MVFNLLNPVHSNATIRIKLFTLYFFTIKKLPAFPQGVLSINVLHTYSALGSSVSFSPSCNLALISANAPRSPSVVFSTLL